MNNTIDVRVPDIGDFADVPIIELPVSVGDVLAEGDTIVVLESDKATLDVPSSHAGRVTEMKVAMGDRVSEGSVILLLEGADASEVSAPPPAPPEAASEPATVLEEVPPAPASAPVPTQTEAPTPPIPPGRAGRRSFAPGAHPAGA